MPINNPDTPIRTALVSALTSATGLPTKFQKIPKDTNPVQKKYIIMDSQSKLPFERTKDCFDWEAHINLNIYIVNTLGYVGGIEMDNYEEQVINTMESLLIPGWMIKRILFIDSNSLNVDTTTASIERKVIQYQILLWQL